MYIEVFVTDFGSKVWGLGTEGLTVRASNSNFFVVPPAGHF